MGAGLPCMISYIIVFLFGVTVGSFLNVCIFRIPRHESIVFTPSHCMTCGKRLKWYELIPLFSFLALRGRCSGCGSPVSVQYPLIEAVNGILWTVVVGCTGFTFNALLLCLMTSALLALSVIDGRTLEIPFGFNIFLTAVGAAATAYDYHHAVSHIIGFFAVSGVLMILFIFSGGRGIGGGDVKLMASCGLIIGWQLIVLAFILGCLFGSVIHLIRMHFFSADRVLAMGPYLSAGIFVAALWGGKLIEWYFQFI